MRYTPPLFLLLGGRPIGRTSDSGSEYPGSSPGLPANNLKLNEGVRAFRSSREAMSSSRRGEEDNKTKKDGGG